MGHLEMIECEGVMMEGRREWFRCCATRLVSKLIVRGNHNSWTAHCTPTDGHKKTENSKIGKTDCC